MSTTPESPDSHPSACSETARPRRVTVTTGCRLHFGLLAHGTTQGRQFGGAGVMLESPGVELVIERAENWSVTGPEPGRSRAEQFVAMYRERSGARRESTPCRVELRRTIPPHAGLGSGTQLGLAVARGLSLLDGDGELPATELARRVARGARSAVGIHGFEQGGFIVDGGKVHSDAVGVLVGRTAFPTEWRFVLVTPPDGPGVSGRAEKVAFERLPPMPSGTTFELRRILLRELVPAVARADFERCGEALFQFNRRVGESFAPIQGGVFASERMAELAETLRAGGMPGVGQTSWGPTLFALVQCHAEAEGLQARVAEHRSFANCAVQIARAQNASARFQAE